MADVSVLGLGRMGSRLAAAFLEAGVEVAVWNRTAGRDGELVDRGASRERSAASALNASPVSVICLDGYRTLLDLVRAAGDFAVSRRTVVSLTSGTPAEAVAAEAAVESLGGTYLDGHISVVPEQIGRESTIITFSGSPTTWELHAPLLRTLGGSSLYLGPDVGSASLMSAPLSAFFHVALFGFFEALVFSRAAGLPIAEFSMLANDRLGSLGDAMQRALAAVVDREFAAQTSTIESHVTALGLFRDMMRDAGCTTNLATEAVEYLEHAVREGKGDLGLAAVTEMMATGAASTHDGTGAP